MLRKRVFSSKVGRPKLDVNQHKTKKNQSTNVALLLLSTWAMVEVAAGAAHQELRNRKKNLYYIVTKKSTKPALGIRRK